MYLLAERVLLDHCVLDQLVQDGIRLDQFAGFELKVHAWLAQRGELQFGHLQLHWDAGFLSVWVRGGVPRVADYSVAAARGTVWDIDFIIYDYSLEGSGFLEEGAKRGGKGMSIHIWVNEGKGNHSE